MDLRPTNGDEKLRVEPYDPLAEPRPQGSGRFAKFSTVFQRSATHVFPALGFDRSAAAGGNISRC